MKKKSFRDIRNAVVMLCIMLAMLSTATFAWFSMNNRVTATGMQVKAKASGSLVIANGASVAKGTVTTDITVTDTAVKNLTPVTYNSTETRWDIVADSSTVSAENGSPNAITKEVTMVPGTHYVDYTVCIASAGEELTGKTLKALVSKGNEDTEVAANAITVAFYVNNAAPTENAEPDEVVQVGASATSIATNLTIDSCATGPGGVPITMRVYFDGAAKDGEGNAYIRSNAVPANAATVTVEFTTIDTAP